VRTIGSYMISLAELAEKLEATENHVNHLTDQLTVATREAACLRDQLRVSEGRLLDGTLLNQPADPRQTVGSASSTVSKLEEQLQKAMDQAMDFAYRIQDLERKLEEASALTAVQANMQAKRSTEATGIPDADTSHSSGQGNGSACCTEDHATHQHSSPGKLPRADPTAEASAPFEADGCPRDPNLYHTSTRVSIPPRPEADGPRVHPQPTVAYVAVSQDADGALARTPTPSRNHSMAASELDAALQRASDQAMDFACRIRVLEGKLAATARRTTSLSPARSGIARPSSSVCSFDGPVTSGTSATGEQERAHHEGAAMNPSRNGTDKPDSGGVIDSMWQALQAKQTEAATLESALRTSESRIADLTHEVVTLQESLGAALAINETLKRGSVRRALSDDNGLPRAWDAVDAMSAEGGGTDVLEEVEQGEPHQLLDELSCT
jgi:hypothetical protein